MHVFSQGKGISRRILTPQALIPLFPVILRRLFAFFLTMVQTLRIYPDHPDTPGGIPEARSGAAPD